MGVREKQLSEEDNGVEIKKKGFKHMRIYKLPNAVGQISNWSTLFSVTSSKNMLKPKKTKI